MKSEISEEAALERARSRLALVRSEWVAHLRESGSSFDSDGAPHSEGGGLGELLGQWWQRHPLKMALDLLVPVLHHQARKHPAGLLALAAVAGAALVMLRPWRALPVAGWMALRALPLDAWLSALRRAVDPGHSSSSRSRSPRD